jgi:hypothetical protein
MCENCIHYLKVERVISPTLIQNCILDKSMIITVHGELIVKQCNKFHEKS